MTFLPGWISLLCQKQLAVAHNWMCFQQNDSSSCFSILQAQPNTGGGGVPTDRRGTYFCNRESWLLFWRMYLSLASHNHVTSTWTDIWKRAAHCCSLCFYGSVTLILNSCISKLNALNKFLLPLFSFQLFAWILELKRRVNQFLTSEVFNIYGH